MVPGYGRNLPFGRCRFRRCLSVETSTKQVLPMMVSSLVNRSKGSPLMAGRYAAVLDSASSVETRAHEMLDRLARHASSSASAICLWDPIARRHIALANHGYPDGVIEHLNTWFIDHDPLFETMCRRGLGALRWRDFPDYRETYSVRGVFVPAGFDEGLSARLVTADGTYAGTIHVNCDDPRYPSDGDVEEINGLRMQIAEHLDFSVRPRMVAELMSPDAQAWAVDASGRTHLLRVGKPSTRWSMRVWSAPWR